MTLEILAATIAARKGADPDTSWTAKLLAKGPEKCAEKFGEEAVEAIIEAVKGDGRALPPARHARRAGRDAGGGSGRAGAPRGHFGSRRESWSLIKFLR